MTKHEYLWCSMYGSYYHPCAIFDERYATNYLVSIVDKALGTQSRTDKEYFIGYFDPVSNDYLKIWVNAALVKEVIV